MQGDDDDDVSFDDVTEIFRKNPQETRAAVTPAPAAAAKPSFEIANEPTMVLSDVVEESWDDATETLSVHAQARLMTTPALPFQQRSQTPRIGDDDTSDDQWADATEKLTPAAQDHLRTAPTLPFVAGQPSSLPTTPFTPPPARPAEPTTDEHERFDDRTQTLSPTEHMIAKHSDVLPFAPTSFLGVPAVSSASPSPRASDAIPSPSLNIWGFRSPSASFAPNPKASRFFHHVAATTTTPSLPKEPDAPRQTDAIPLVHEPTLSVRTFPWMFQGNRFLRTIVVKTTCTIVPNDVARAREEPKLIVGDSFHEDAQSLRYASDFAPQKPKADITLVGHAHARGAAVESAIVAFRFGHPAKGGFERRIQVFGQRRFERAPNGTIFPGKPLPWTRVPLVYERAFGGPDCPDNPVGMGKDGAFAPQLEHPTRLLRNPQSTIPAICFGPIAPSWPIRASKLGTFDASWSAHRWPSLPADHDWTHWQAAPSDQQLEHVRGDEEFVLTGVHPEHEIIAGRLPGRKARCFAEKNGELHEVPLRLDTVAFNADQLEIDLVFRGSIEVADEDATDVAALFVLVEPCAGPSHSREEVEAKYQAHKIRLQAASPKPLEKPANDQSTDSFAPRQAQVQAALAAGGAVSLGAMPAAQAHETSAPVDLPQDAPDPARRRHVEMLMAQGASLAGLDLENADLSEMDLSGQTLSRSNLRRANLRGAKLEGADLSYVQASDAIFTSVHAARIKLDYADLTACNLDDADLTEASLDGTILSDTHASGAIFRRARGTSVQCLRAAFGFAVFDQAELPRADFSSASLENASFTQARLADVRFYDATGHAVVFDDAVISGARADATTFEHASFVNAEASGSVWDQAKLSAAKFTGSTFTNASFQRADLERAVFSGAKLVGAVFRKAVLSHAKFDKANLMHASLENADLENAVFRDANLYGAETWQANVQRIDLKGALLGKTKLEGDKK